MDFPTAGPHFPDGRDSTANRLLATRGPATNTSSQRQILLNCWRLSFRCSYSGSEGLLNNTVNLMLPCPNCGKLVLLGSPGSRFDAVSSGGNRIRELRKACSAFWSF